MSGGKTQEPVNPWCTCSDTELRMCEQFPGRNNNLRRCRGHRQRSFESCRRVEEWLTQRSTAHSHLSKRIRFDKRFSGSQNVDVTAGSRCLAGLTNWNIRRRWMDVPDILKISETPSQCLCKRHNQRLQANERPVGFNGGYTCTSWQLSFIYFANHENWL